MKDAYAVVVTGEGRRFKVDDVDHEHHDLRVNGEMTDAMTVDVVRFIAVGDMTIERVELFYVSEYGEHRRVRKTWLTPYPIDMKRGEEITIDFETTITPPR